MGQKISPIGRRLGTLRKWSESLTTNLPVIADTKSRGGLMISGIEMLLSNLFVDNTENHGNTVLPVRVELFFTDTQSCLVTYHYYYASYDTDENEEFEDLVSDVQSTPELYKVRNIDKAQTFYIKSGNIVVQHSAQHITNILRILRGKTTQLFLVNSWCSFLRAEVRDKGSYVLNELAAAEARFEITYGSTLVYQLDIYWITTIGRYTKNVKFRLEFYAYALSHLSTLRIETVFIRTLIGAVKNIASLRKDITGRRIVFSGRVNRWNRTKDIKGSWGYVPTFTYTEFVEFSQAVAINRKGSIGISIWLSFKANFNKSLHNHFQTLWTDSAAHPTRISGPRRRRRRIRKKVTYISNTERMLAGEAAWLERETELSEYRGWDWSELDSN